MARIIAFIPARGGSKSIPNKNIKNLGGKPLIHWTLIALERCNLVNEIIVATNSEKIENIVYSLITTKTKIYHRLDENATDQASTESVILEYLDFAKDNLSGEDIFILAQATSPFTTDIHFKEAIEKYLNNNFDSIISCVRSKKFIWNENGTSKNYNHFKRPRRQEFKGELFENGAFYISKVKTILESRNRISGNIGIYEMPEYSLVELDEEFDWILAESILRHKKKQNTAKRIKLFLTDVDGVLTDGNTYLSNSGDEFKRFSTYDEMAFELLRNSNIKTGILTSENTRIVELRARKIKADYLYQNVKGAEKLEIAISICNQLNISLEEVSYIGDDINCIELLSNVGISACPSNSVDEVKAIPNIIHLKQKGGFGVVSEFCKIILNNYG